MISHRAELAQICRGRKQFSSSLKAASCQLDAYEPAQLREGTCLRCLHRNPMTAAQMLSQALLAALNRVAHGFDFGHLPSLDLLSCFITNLCRGIQSTSVFLPFRTKTYMLYFTWD